MSLSATLRPPEGRDHRFKSPPVVAARLAKPAPSRANSAASQPVPTPRMRRPDHQHRQLLPLLPERHEHCHLRRDVGVVKESR